MGSSKTGSLDKFVPFSSAAALASGKVKLPETGVIGMMQQRQEDKMQMNAANIAAQQAEASKKAKQAEFMQNMRARMQGGQGTPLTNLFMQDGGHVALRRKMFKLGGSASSHGVGLTSGLSFNQGGRVHLRSGSGPSGVLESALAAGGARGKAVGKGLGFLRRLLGLGSTRGKSVTSDIADIIRGPRTAPDAGFLMRTLGKPSARALRAAGLAGAGLAPVGIASAVADRLGVEYADPNEPVREDANALERLVRRGRQAGEFGLDYLTLPGAAVDIGDFLIKPPDMELQTLSDIIAGRERTPIEQQTLDDDKNYEPGMTPDELRARADAQQRADLEAAMAMYQDLIRGEDNTNKLMTLGDAAIAAGSALMEGEGYGRAAAAFNEPLTQARASQQERDEAARAAAAQLAIGEDIASRQADRARSDQLLATGDFDTEEEINAVLLARQFGITQRIPEDDKGEVVEDIRDKPGVYVDPKQRYRTLFVAINSKGEDLKTNDPELAKQHAED